MMGTKSRLVKFILETAVNLCGTVVEISSGEREARGSMPNRLRFVHAPNLVCVSLPVLYSKLIYIKEGVLQPKSIWCIQPLQ